MPEHRALTEQNILSITKTRGINSQPWLMRLPEILSACEQKWQLNIEKAFPNLTYNYTASAKRIDGTVVVLKVGLPTDIELKTEAHALQIFDGRGTVRLLELDLDLGAMLLERLEPGIPLKETLDDEKAISVASQLMQKLWRPVPANHSFPTTMSWANGFIRMRKRYSGGTGPLPNLLVEQAERLFAKLHASQTVQVLLHGDLHQDNILAASSRILAGYRSQRRNR